MNHADPGPGALRGGFQLPQFDFRSDGQIDREIDEEIAFHLDSLAREFAADGAAPEEARARAIERFGDVESIKTQCRHIALEDRIMLQKINFALMLIVLAAVIGVSLYVMTTQKHNTLALNEIITRIASMRMEAEAAARQQAEVAQESARAAQEQANQERARAEAVTDFLQSVLAGTDPTQADGISVLDLLHEAEQRIPTTFADQPEVAAKMRQAIEEARQRAMVEPQADSASPDAADLPQARVLIEGDIQKPGWYPISMDSGTTLGELLRSANVEKDQWVLYRRAGMTVPATYRPVTHYLDTSGYQFILKPGDELVVRDGNVISDRQRRKHYISVLASSRWREVDDAGQVIESGCTIHFDRAEGYSLCNGRLECGSLKERISLSEDGLIAGKHEPPMTAMWMVDNDLLLIRWGKQASSAGESRDMKLVRVNEGE